MYVIQTSLDFNDVQISWLALHYEKYEIFDVICFDQYGICSVRQIPVNGFWSKQYLCLDLNYLKETFSFPQRIGTYKAHGMGRLIPLPEKK